MPDSDPVELRFRLDPGDAPVDVVVELLAAIDGLHRAYGGSGLDFRFDGEYLIGTAVTTETTTRQQAQATIQVMDALQKMLHPERDTGEWLPSSLAERSPRLVPYLGGPWDGEACVMLSRDIKPGLRKDTGGGFYLLCPDMRRGYHWRWYSNA
jgi:hypothetical protein